MSLEFTFLGGVLTSKWWELLRCAGRFGAVALVCSATGALAATEDAVILDELRRTGATVELHRETGLVRFLGAPAGRALALPRPAHGSTQISSIVASEAFLARYGPALGVRDPASQLRLMDRGTRASGGSSWRYQQVFQGIPVLSGELRVNLDAANALLSIHGEISPDLELSTVAHVPAEAAHRSALEGVAKWHEVRAQDLSASPPELMIYDPRLLTQSALAPMLVWHVEVASITGAPIRELVLLDATSAAVALHFNQVGMERNRETYAAGGGSRLPGLSVVSEADSSDFGGDRDAQNAHVFSGNTYDFYSSAHGRDSIDGQGGTIVSTVHWNDGMSCPSAFWNGEQVVYCDGMADADDIVAHELTHGVTNHSSRLLYYYEPGAISESLSDVWGEFVDLTNGSGTDTEGVRWLIGEDAAVLGGPIRDMENPPAFGDPDRIGSPDYWTGSTDNGGVHHNSGINNKAASLITDGGTFNGVHVNGLGIEKAARIYYELQVNQLLSASDYADLHSLLVQSCINLVGTADITSLDCEQVRHAVDAVEMDQEPRVGSADAKALFCPPGESAVALTSGSTIGSASAWRTVTLQGPVNPWVLGGDYLTASSPLAGVSDSVALLGSASSLPLGAFLRMRHAFAFEGPGNDGGVAEYSIDGGRTWNDLGTLFDAGRDYTGIISGCCGNPLAGRRAFLGESHGQVASRFDLSSLAGQDFEVRLRQASDSSLAGPLGWVVYDMAIYTCQQQLSGDPSCSGVDVLIQDRTFLADTICEATSSLTTQPSVTVAAGAVVTFQSPVTRLGDGFGVQLGGELLVVAGGGAPADWSSAHQVCWSLDEPSGDRFPSSEQCIGTCVMSQSHPIGNDPLNMVEGSAAADFSVSPGFPEENLSCSVSPGGACEGFDNGGSYWIHGFARRADTSSSHRVMAEMQGGGSGSGIAVHHRGPGSTQDNRLHTYSSTIPLAQSVEGALPVNEMYYWAGYWNGPGNLARLNINGEEPAYAVQNDPGARAAPDRGAIYIANTTFDKAWEGQLDELCFMNPASDITLEDNCRVCSVLTSGALGWCANNGVDYGSCSDDADCGDRAGACDTLTGTCTGRNRTGCGSCTLPACNSPAPG